MTSATPRPPICYSVRDASKQMGISRSKLYELLGAGEIKALKIGNKTVVPHQELDRLITELPAWRPRTAA